MAGVIYSLNGIPLHDAARGWRVLRSGTSTQGGVTRLVPKVTALGQDGYTPVPTTFGEQIIVFVVQTTRAGLEPLLNLADAASILRRVGDSTKEAYVQLNSAIPGGQSVYDATFDVTITLSIYQGVWRDVDYTVEGPFNIISPNDNFSFMAGLGAPVRDMDVFIRGVFGQMTLTDSRGSWVRTTSAWAGSSSTGLLYRGSTGQAFVANESDPWTALTDRTNQVDVSGNGGFKMTPFLFENNPSSRFASVSVVTLTQTSTSIRVRSKRAYRMN